MDATFSHLWKIADTCEHEHDAGSALEIRPQDEVACSIRDGCVKPPNLELYRDLSSPPVRAVYRILAALRRDCGFAQDRGTDNLLEGGKRLSIGSTEPDRARRILQRAAEELTGHSILLAARVEGCGKLRQAPEPDARLSPVGQRPDPGLLKALTLGQP